MEIGLSDDKKKIDDNKSDFAPAVIFPQLYTSFKSVIPMCEKMLKEPSS